MLSNSGTGYSKNYPNDLLSCILYVRIVILKNKILVLHRKTCLKTEIDLEVRLFWCKATNKIKMFSTQFKLTEEVEQK